MGVDVTMGRYPPEMVRFLKTPPFRLGIVVIFVLLLQGRFLRLFRFFDRQIAIFDGQR